MYVTLLSCSAQGHLQEAGRVGELEWRSIAFLHGATSTSLVCRGLTTTHR
jgi:hypothetical protein